MAAAGRLHRVRKLSSIISNHVLRNTLSCMLVQSQYLRGPSHVFRRNLCSFLAADRKDDKHIARSKQRALTDASSAIRKCCRKEDFQTAKQLLNDLFLVHGIHNLTKCYNCIMYYSVNCGHFEECMKLKSEMESRKIPMDDSSYFILASLYAKSGFLNEGRQLLEDVGSKNVKLQARIFNCLITAAADKGEMRTAFDLFNKMKRYEKLRCDSCYASIISAAAKSAEEIWREKARAIISDLKGCNDIGCLTLSAIKDFFESNRKEMWVVKEAEINTSGECSSCGQFLDSGKLSETEHAQLKHQLGSRWQDILSWSPSKNMRCFTSVGNYVDTPGDVVDGIPRSVAHFIQTTGPYDIVIDALNVGYMCVPNTHNQALGNRFKPQQVEVVASHFLKQNKRVLVIGAKPMTFGVLRKTHTNQFRKSLKSVLIFLQENCGIMLVVDSFSLPHVHTSRYRPLDDLHILCAAMHCGPNTQLVSNDKFADHLGQLDQRSRQAFQRWYRLNQICLETFVKGHPVFKKEPPFNPVVQTTGKTWHFPSEVPGKWLCATKLPETD